MDMRITIEKTKLIGDDMYAYGCIYHPYESLDKSTKKEERYIPIRFNRYCPIPPKALLGTHSPFLVNTRPGKGGDPEITTWTIITDNDEVIDVSAVVSFHPRKK